MHSDIMTTLCVADMIQMIQCLESLFYLQLSNNNNVSGCVHSYCWDISIFGRQWYTIWQCKYETLFGWLPNFQVLKIFCRPSGKLDSFNGSRTTEKEVNRLPVCLR
jgi:hypothetical protein